MVQVNTVSVKVVRTSLGEQLNIPLPEYQTPLSAGADLAACLEAPISIPPGGTALIPTGLMIELPAGYELQVRPRSGLALKKAITVLNSPGTIDADYRGEIGVILINHGKDVFLVNHGDRIAQMVIAAHAQAAWKEADRLSSTERGQGGFGSTGV